MPRSAAVVGSGRYGVLVWRSDGGAAPTELNLPAGFAPSATAVVSDLGTVAALPAYSATGQAAASPIAYAPLPSGGGAERLLLSDSGPTGTLHYALVTNGAGAATAAQLAGAKTELASWISSLSFP